MTSASSTPVPGQEGTAAPDLFGIVELLGPDAAAFAQAQTMNDVRPLQDGRWQWNGCLNPKGRVMALFALLRIAPDRFWMLLPDVDVQAFSQQLLRFVFRSKLRVASRPDLAAVGFGAARPLPTPASDLNLATGSVEGGLSLDFSGETGRLLWLGPRELPVPTPSGLHAMSAAAWAGDDIAHGLPRIDPAMAERFTPQMLGLDALRAYSIKKGCYPGQEIVARTHFLGSAKRKAIRLRADRALEPGEAVECDGKELGIVVCTNIHNQHNEAIAVVPRDDESAKSHCTLASDHAAVIRVPFALGLAR